MELNIPKEVLVKTRELVAAGWHQGGNLARNIDGHGFDWLHPKSTSFTMQGAFYRAAHKRKCSVQMFLCVQEMITQAIARVVGRPMYIYDYDDRNSTTQESSLQVLDEAIRIADEGIDIYEPGIHRG